MKYYVYTTKDEDGIYGMLAMSSHKHFMAEQIRDFFQKVGKYKPVDWVILGEYESKTGKIEPYGEEVKFDFQAQLDADSIKDVPSSVGVETSDIAREIEND